MLRTILISALLTVSVAGQRVFHTVDRALRVAFPDAKVARSTELLSAAEREQIGERSGVTAPRRMVFPYVARQGGKVVGTAYFDTHRVRTLRETVMVVVGADGRVAKVLLCAFAEPLDYVPRPRFYQQFERRRLDDDLRLRRGIDGMTGATLTSRATTDCVRRVLAIHEVVLARRQARVGREEGGEKGEGGETPPKAGGGPDPVARERRQEGGR